MRPRVPHTQHSCSGPPPPHSRAVWTSGHFVCNCPDVPVLPLLGSIHPAAGRPPRPPTSPSLAPRPESLKPVTLPSQSSPHTCWGSVSNTSPATSSMESTVDSWHPRMTSDPEPSPRDLPVRVPLLPVQPVALPLGLGSPWRPDSACPHVPAHHPRGRAQPRPESTPRTPLNSPGVCMQFQHSAADPSWAWVLELGAGHAGRKQAGTLTWTGSGSTTGPPTGTFGGEVDSYK